MDSISRDLYHLFEEFNYTVGYIECSEKDNEYVVYFDVDCNMDNIQLFLKLESELVPFGFYVYRLIKNIGAFWVACIIIEKEE